MALHPLELSGHIFFRASKKFLFLSLPGHLKKIKLRLPFVKSKISDELFEYILIGKVKIEQFYQYFRNFIRNKMIYIIRII